MLKEDTVWGVEPRVKNKRYQKRLAIMQIMLRMPCVYM